MIVGKKSVSVLVENGIAAFVVDLSGRNTLSVQFIQVVCDELSCVVVPWSGADSVSCVDGGCAEVGFPGFAGDACVLCEAGAE